MIQELVQEISNMILRRIGDVHTAFPAKIVKYDASTNLAEVQPTMKFFTPSGDKMDYPKLTGVPVVIPQSNNQKCTIAFPIKEGDGCLVIVSEQSLDLWMYGQESDTNLRHDLSNSICIVGLFRKVNELEKEACENNSMIVNLGGAKITVSEDDEEVKVEAKKFTVDAEEININADDGDITINDVSFMEHTHAESGTETSEPTH